MDRRTQLLEKRKQLSPERQALLDRVLRGNAGRGTTPPGSIPRRPAGEAAPLSFAQQRLWAIQELDPGSPAYNEPEALPIGGALDLPALERSLTEIVRRHEVLRSVFVLEDGEPVQRVRPAPALRLPVVDLSGAAPEARPGIARRLAREEAARPFDLGRDLLLRATLVRLRPEEHVLLLTTHHAAWDGWSQGVFTRELSVLYAAFTRGAPSPLPELPVQYADYAAWQRERIRGERLEAELGYWRGRVAGAPTLLELPVDHPRPPVQTAPAGHEPVPLAGPLAAGVLELARAEGTTPFVVLLAAFHALLARHTGQLDLLVGTPASSRSRPELEGLIGFFVNTLVVRADLSANPTFRELVRQVREAVLEAQQHQDLPLEVLVRELAPERDPSRNPLFQASFALQRGGSAAAPPGAGLAMGGPEAGGGMARFDLFLHLMETEGALGGHLEYRRDLFEPATVRGMAARFRTLLEAAVADPARRVLDVPILGEDELRRVVAEWNATAAPYPTGECLHRLVERQVDRTPDAVAVVFEGERVTYRELDARANRLAHHLQRLGVGPEARVGICLERSPDMVVALLAVLKAGGAYVPVDPGYPRDRIAYLLGDSAVPVLLTQERLLPLLPDSPARVVCLDRDRGEVDAEPEARPRAAVSAGSLAYVIYTSGSTGRPKGAMNEHRGVVNRLLWMQEEYGLDASDAVLQKTPFSFDVSVWEFFWPLMTGARMVVARPEGHRDPVYLSELIEREGVTTLHFVPSMLHAFLQAGEPERCGSLKRVVCSGEALAFELQERFAGKLPGVELHNLYGPTEAAVDVTYWACVPGDGRGVVPIGRPVANTRILVLDGSLNPVPAGVSGELFIGGVQVGRGYLGRPELTAERFVPDPLGTEPGARLYRTGDRVRWLPDGVLEYLGRMDFQVKVRGFRIELGEIESVLLAHPAVREAAVVARGDGAGGQRLAAYVVPAAAGEDPSPGDLRAHLLERVPEYMVPGAFVLLEALPLTPNGKLDRRALPDPAPAAAAAASGYTAPSTPAERILAELWAELLRVERVGVHENFFELGGDSILSIQIVARARERGLR
ncbi:MAG TPA: amino acid adenylation domain-containing protein, partial [Longimicrobiaceae bacterium]|nr:amino acid adenylation domain-containing protein [Longimicrobiaceae bacterium]